MSSSRTPPSSASSTTLNEYTLWGLSLDGVYKEIVVKASSIREAKQHHAKFFHEGVGGCCRGDIRGQVAEPGGGPAFIDAVCPSCGKKNSWFGTLENPPPCRHCGNRTEMTDMTELRMKYILERCKYYEHLSRGEAHVNDPPPQPQPAPEPKPGRARKKE